MATVGLLVAAALAFGCGNADAGPEPENTEQESMDGTGILQGNLMTAAEDTQARIWKIVIIVLVAAVFVTGLISTLKKDKIDKKGQKDRKQN